MNVVLIGAGRGQRLMPLTAVEPKGFAGIAGKRILDWTIQAFQENGLNKFVFIGGYLKEIVSREYPEFTMANNLHWSTTNILFSLICARDYLRNGFYGTYTDTVYRADAVRALMASPHDITLVMDTLWRERYLHRSQHPEDDGEKMIVRDGRVTRISREIAAEDASGEFTGLFKMTAEGAAKFLGFHDRLLASIGADGIFADNRPFRTAYLIHQLDLMIQDGADVHCVDVPGDYHEIDTLEDYHLANEDWARFSKISS